MNNQDRWADLLKNEYFDQYEYLKQFTPLEKHPHFAFQYGNCLNPKCESNGGMKVAEHNGEVRINCHACGLEGNILDGVIYRERIRKDDPNGMASALDIIEAWVLERMPKTIDELGPMPEGEIEDYQGGSTIIQASTDEQPSGDWVTNGIKKIKKRNKRN